MAGEPTPNRRRVTVLASPPPMSPVRSFARAVARDCPAGARVLNIGAGSNLSGALDPVRARAGHLVGIDPDPAIWENAGVDERHQLSLEQYAATAPEPFDVAFSVFVLEHVSDPVAFTAACARILKPGGVLRALTVNKLHYFGLSTWVTTRLHVGDWLLARLRPPEEVAAYHFPTEYRMNTAGVLGRLLLGAGFDDVTFTYWDKPAMYEPYLPERLTGFARRYHDVVYRVGQPQLMGNLTLRATRG